MNYWNVLKYVLMVMFTLIIVGAVYSSQDADTTSQQNVPQATQSKFNI